MLFSQHLCSIFGAARVTTLLMSYLMPSAIHADELKLKAPAGWGGETIQLPPGFAPNMSLKGEEHIRFAPGMMQPGSDSFFSYAFVFELDRKPKLTMDVVREEFLKYYRGLCMAVLNGKRPDVDPAGFTLTLKEAKAAKANSDAASNRKPQVQGVMLYEGELQWVEPFQTRKTQTLNLVIHTWSSDNHNYLFACVSPMTKTEEVWRKLEKIRSDYMQTRQ